ncbi:response regulator transcription factor [Clostridium sp. WILCCON 0269]|uniref:Stage 0 sporulation protein A homolog n=1 Tax=Candidatus Clostridium eludens TaxID=3381663 RepID=A0ABW8SRA9_9CLOT
MTKKIYLVEDEHNLNRLLEKYLQKEGYDVTTFFNGNCAKNRIKDTPNLWILDIMLPDISGYELIKYIKQNNKNTPVIFMSARNREFDKIIGLELGSDDYLSKPFLPRELVIRTNNLMKKIYRNTNTTDITESFNMEIGGYSINKKQRMVLFRGKEIRLTNKEFELLSYLAENKNNLILRDQILTNVWGINYFGSGRVVDDTIRRLRKRVDRLTIETIYGHGYKLLESL